MGYSKKIRLPLWKATSNTGPVGIFFQRSRQNFEPLGCKLQRFQQQKTRVSETVLLWEVGILGGGGGVWNSPKARAERLPVSFSFAPARRRTSIASANNFCIIGSFWTPQISSLVALNDGRFCILSSLTMNNARYSKFSGTPSVWNRDRRTNL